MADKKLHRQRKRKKIFRILRAVLLLLIAMTVVAVVCYYAYTALSTGVFDIKHIDVEGADILPAEEIIAASEIQEGENIFLLDSNAARYNISKVLSADSVVIKKVLPDKIRIIITENEPLGVIAQDGKYYYISPSQHLMEITAELSKDSIPLITGFNHYDFGPAGSRVEMEPDYKFDAAVKMLRLFERNHLLDQLSEINLTKNNDYRIITKNGVAFTVKDFANLQEYFSYVSTVMENGEKNLDINLTSGNNPIKKPR